MGSSQLSIDLHDQLSLPLQFLLINIFSLLEVHTRLVSSLCDLDFPHPGLDDLVFQKDTLLKLLNGLSETLLSRAVMSLVVGTLLVKFKF